MDLSIIIISFNTKDLLDRCLASVFRSLQASELTFEVLVVDNGSTDGSRDILSNKYTRVIKMFNNDNLGFGNANNQAIKKARGRQILLLNSDTEVIDNAIEILYHFGLVHPQSFIGGKLLNSDGSPQSSCGPAFSLLVVALMLFAKGDQLGITRYSPDNVKAVFWVSGACIMAPKQAFLDVGLFDEGIFMYMEEVEFLARAAKKGYTTLFFPDARFTHVGAASSGTRREPVLNIYRGLLYFYRKHRSIMEQRVLAVMLRAKARLAVFVGNLTGNALLTATYEEALQLV